MKMQRKFKPRHVSLRLLRSLVIAFFALQVTAPAAASDLRWSVDAQSVVNSNVTTDCAASAKQRARRVDSSRLVYSVRLTPVPEDAPESVDVRIIVGEAGGSPGPAGACGAIARVAIPVAGATVEVSGMRFRIKLVGKTQE